MKYFISAIFVIFTLFFGCHKTDVKPEVEVVVTVPPSNTVPNGATISVNSNGDATISNVPLDGPPPTVESSPSLTGRTPLKSVAGQVFFAFDKHAIDDDVVDVLLMVADYLKTNNEKIIIEGNCDERGSIEYNQVLGYHRAKNVETILSINGISQDRIIEVLSNGKGNPICDDHNESCWKKNRRVDIIVKGE